KMIVGFMRRYVTPPKITELIAMVSKYKGIDLVYLKPSDIDITNNKANGKMLINDEWVKVETHIPGFIDITPYLFTKKNQKMINHLRSNSILSHSDRVYFTKSK